MFKSTSMKRILQIG